MARMPHRGPADAVEDRVTIESEKSADAFLANWVRSNLRVDSL